MRPSKSRSRSKPNRPRSIGNIINRVFESSGPEGKVRGTPQQIIEKYLLLARDAQLSNDRVAAENFLQHSEHYTRMLGEAQRELAAEQEARTAQQNQQAQQGQQAPRQNGERFERREDRGDYRPYPRAEDGEEQPPMASFEAEPAGYRFAEEEAGLVETPEARPVPVQAERQDRGDRPERNNDRQDRGNRNERNRNDGQRNDGQRNEGQRNEGPRNDAPRNDAPRNDAPRNDAPRNEGQRAEGGERRPPREPRPPRPEPAPVVAERVNERVEEAAPSLPLEGGAATAPDAPKADRAPRRAPRPRKPAEPKSGGDGGPMEAAE